MWSQYVNKWTVFTTLDIKELFSSLCVQYFMLPDATTVYMFFFMVVFIKGFSS